MNTSIENLLLKSIRIGAVLALFTPLVMGPFGLSFSEYPKALYFRTLTEIVLILWMVLLVVNPRYLPKFTLLAFSVLLFFVILVISSLLGFNLTRSIWGGLEVNGGLILIFHYIAFFLVLSAVFRDKASWIFLLKWAVGVSFLTTLAGFMQKAGIAEFYGVGVSAGRISGTLSNAVYYGAYMVMAIFMGLYLFVLEKSKEGKAVWGAITLLNFVGLAMSGTRGGFAGFLFGAGILGILIFFAYVKPRLRLWVLGLVLPASLVLLFAVSSLPVDFLNQTGFSRLFSVFDPSALEGRFPGWETALRAWQDRPLLGWGQESFHYLYDKYFDSHYLNHISGYIVFFDAHNMLMNFLAEAGILGVASYLLILALVFYALWFGKKSGGLLPSFILIALFAGHFFQNMFAFDTLSTYVVFFFLLAFVSNNYSYGSTRILNGSTRILNGFTRILNGLTPFNNARSNTTWAKLLNPVKQFCPLRTVGAGIGILVVLWALYFVNLKPALASYKFVRGFFMENQDVVQSRANYKWAIDNAGPYKREFVFIMVSRDITLLDQGKDVNEARFLATNLLEFIPQMESLAKTPDFRYLNFQELLAKAKEWIFLLKKDEEYFKGAKKHAEEILEFNDQWFQLYYFLGRLYIYEGKFEEAEGYYERGFKLTRQDFFDAFSRYKDTTVAYNRAGQKEKVAESSLRGADALYALLKIGTSDRPLEEQRKYTQSYVAFFDFTAWNNWQIGNKETALELYEKALEVMPEWEVRLKTNREKMQNQ